MASEAKTGSAILFGSNVSPILSLAKARPKASRFAAEVTFATRRAYARPLLTLFKVGLMSDVKNTKTRVV